MDVYKECCDTLTTAEDELWLYGFSRGAYIARAVAALFSHIGALDTDVIKARSKATTFEDIYNKAIKLYEALRDGKTGGPASSTFPMSSTVILKSTNTSLRPIISTKPSPVTRPN